MNLHVLLFCINSINWSLTLPKGGLGLSLEICEGMLAGLEMFFS